MCYLESTFVGFRGGGRERREIFSLSQVNRDWNFLEDIKQGIV